MPTLLVHPLISWGREKSGLTLKSRSSWKGSKSQTDSGKGKGTGTARPLRPAQVTAFDVTGGDRKAATARNKARRNQANSALRGKGHVIIFPT